MAQLKRRTHEFTPAQDAFLKRKVRELQRLVPPGSEARITENVVLQGLLDFWMNVEKSSKEVPHKRNARKGEAG